MADSLTSDQVNYMIWRYLQESGFRDSASSFQHDSKAERLDVTYRSHVKSGLLIYLIQRGLQYEELAAQVDRDGTIQKPARPFQFFPSAPGLVLDEDEGVGSDGHQLDEGDDDEEGSVTLQSKSPPATSTTSTNAKKHPIEDGVNGVSKKRRKKASNGLDGDVLMADPVPSPPPPPPPPLPPLTDHLPATNGCDAGTQIEDPVEVVAADTLALEEDDAILYCVWNPGRDTPTLLASGGLVARIWDVPPDAAFSQATKSCLLSHEPSRKSTGKASITAIRWSPDGSKLASGSYDGQTRTWTADGIMEHNMLLHDAPVSSLRWNAPASTLLALSCDGKMIAWDTAAGDQRRSWDLGSDASLVEIEWISESQFMACAENGDLYQFDVAVDGHLDVRRLHDGEVGCLAWDQASSTIATGGNDMSIRIWHKPSKDSSPEAKLVGHTAPIVSVAWQPDPDYCAARSPEGPKRILASASNDTTIRLWDAVPRTCLRVLTRHVDPIEKICFSPDGTKLASGANGAVLVWRTDSGALTHVYDRAKSQRKTEAVDAGEIGGISWDESGQRLAIGERLDGSQKCTIVSIKPETTSTGS